MVTQIQLGNFFTANGRTVLGGVGGTGLDTEALINALAQARRAPAVQLENKVALNAKKATALSEFQTLLSTLKDSANFLRNPPGVGNAANNAFKYVAASLSTNFGESASSYVTVSAVPGTVPQSYTISEIASVAKAKKQATDNIAIANADVASAVSATPGADQFKAGTFTLMGEDITLAAGDTLNQVAAKINAVKDATGIAASVIKVSDGNFRLSFSATGTGTDLDFDFNNIDVPGTLVDPGDVFDNFVISTTQEVSDAVFTLDGVEVTRQQNSVGDVIAGVTFNILQATPADPMDEENIEVTITPDTQVAKNGIINFINAYNEVKLFAARQTELDDDGTFAEDAVLANNPVFRSTMTALNAHLSTIVSGIVGDDPNRLAEIGITFVDLPESADNPLVRNILNVDDAALTAAISNNFDGVRRVFEFELTSDNTNLQAFSHTKTLGVADFTLTIGVNGSSATATYVGAPGSPLTLTIEAITGGTGYTITGPAGSVLDGLVLIYGSAAAATIDVTATQGIADRLFNTGELTLNSGTGLLPLELESLKTSDEKLEEEIARIDEQVAAYREQLLAKFTALEQAISRVNTLLQSLDAQAQARQNNS